MCAREGRWPCSNPTPTEATRNANSAQTIGTTRRRVRFGRTNAHRERLVDRRSLLSHGKVGSFESSACGSIRLAGIAVGGWRCSLELLAVPADASKMLPIGAGTVSGAVAPLSRE